MMLMVLGIRMTFLVTAATVALVWMTCVARADTVKIFRSVDFVPFGSPVAVNNYYNSLAGDSSTLDRGAITSAGLAGVDLLISWGRTAAFTASEISAMAAFLAGGGRIAFFGENDNPGFDDLNNNINAALTGLG